MNLYDIFMSSNIDHMLDMYDEIQETSVYSPYLDLPTLNSSELFDIICDNLIFIEASGEDDDEYADENEYYNFET